MTSVKIEKEKHVVWHSQVTLEAGGFTSFTHICDRNIFFISFKMIITSTKHI